MNKINVIVTLSHIYNISLGLIHQILTLYNAYILFIFMYDANH